VFSTHEGNLRQATVGVVGLGAGELASYATVGQHWTFFEIDPVVERIARERFSFLSGAPVAIEVALGDGRVSIERSSSRFDLLIMDAFSSDAIPRHLITVEAFQLYLNRLMPNGVIALHISNRFVDLEPTLARLAQVLGLAGLIQFDSPTGTGVGADVRLASSWVVLARTTADLGGLARDSRWRRLQSDGEAPWTDEKADILSAIRWRAVSSLAQR
jgi:spermidine synthase